MDRGAASSSAHILHTPPYVLGFWKDYCDTILQTTCVTDIWIPQEWDVSGRMWQSIKSLCVACCSFPLHSQRHGGSLSFGWRLCTQRMSENLMWQLNLLHFNYLTVCELHRVLKKTAKRSSKRSFKEEEMKKPVGRRRDNKSFILLSPLLLREKWDPQ